MSTRSPQRHPPGDRLERLLRTADGAAADGPSEPDVAGAGVPFDDRATGGRHRALTVPLLSVPESLRSADLGVGARAVRGLLVLVVVATLVLGGRWLWTQRMAVASPSDRVATSGSVGPDQPVAPGGGDERSDPGPEGGPGPVAGGSEEDQPSGGVHDETVPGSSGSTAAQPAAAGLVVHVAGEVVDPGVVSLPSGSRVVDAVRAAGGVTDAADQTTLNLARPLVDGERVWVGRPGEEPPVVAPGPLPGSAPGAGAGGGDGAGGSPPPAPLDLNAATQADLEELPGVGPVTAGHILGWREEHGRFSSVDELLEVSGIGERTLAQLAPLVTVGG